MVRLRAFVERFRSSLFFLPLLFVVAAVGLAQLMVWVDAQISAEDLPDVLVSTVSSARAVLGTVAGATITVAGVVFSITVVSLQLASSQFSPRVLRGFLRDRFQQSVMGLVVGTFTYCLLVLRAVRSPAEEAGQPVIPNLSVIVAVTLAVMAAILILAYIDHGAKSMQVSNIIRGIAEETLERVRELEAGRGPVRPMAADVPQVRLVDDAHVVRARVSGWVQQIDPWRLLEGVPEGTEVCLEIREGHYVAKGTPLCAVSPRPEDPERVDDEIHDAIHLGAVRTMQQDIAFGIRQLADIGLRALSPGINDPTTAQEVIVHMGAVTRELLLRDLPPPKLTDERGRALLRPHQLGHEDYVRRAFDQIRRAGAGRPAVAQQLLSTLGVVKAEVVRGSLPDRAEMLQQQADLVLDGCKQAGPLPEDLEEVQRRYRAAGFVSS